MALIKTTQVIIEGCSDTALGLDPKTAIGGYPSA